MPQRKSSLSCFSNLCQPKRQTRSSREAKVNVCPCLPCQWKRMPLIMRGDKWLSGANPKLNKWLFSLFAQGFLHNKAQRGDVCSIKKKKNTPNLYLHWPGCIFAIRWKPCISKCGDFHGFQINWRMSSSYVRLYLGHIQTEGCVAVWVVTTRTVPSFVSSAWIAPSFRQSPLSTTILLTSQSPGCYRSLTSGCLAPQLEPVSTFNLFQPLT